MISESTAAEPTSGGELEIPKNVDQMKEFPQILNQVYKSVMQKGTDYGVIPGTPKPTLYKPGAEILTRFFSLAADLKVIAKVEDVHPDHPYFDYTVECRIYAKDGFIGNGSGSCNSRETRYAFRWVYERQLPEGTDKSKMETRGEGNKTQYKVPTPADEVFGIKNTVLKMAEKRAFVDAVLRVTGASRIFTQDVEDKAPDESILQQASGLDEIEYALRDYQDKVKVEESLTEYKVVPSGVDSSEFSTIKAILEGMGFKTLSAKEGGPAFTRHK